MPICDFVTKNCNYMIDFIKLNMYVPSAEELTERIVFTSDVDVNTGEVVSRKRLGRLENLKLILIGNRLIISGSLHVYHNQAFKNELQNYDDFTIEALVKTIGHIEDQFGFSIGPAKVINLEVGVNILMDSNVTDLLSKHLVSYKYQRPSGIDTFNGSGMYVRFKLTEYWIKIYDKGRQHKLGKQLLRVEIKLIRGSIINRSKVMIVKDLYKEENWHLLSKFLLDRLEYVLIVDTQDTSNVQNIQEREMIKDGLNPGYWANLPYKVTRNTIRRRKRVFERALEKNKFLNLKKEIALKVQEKLAVLCKAHKELEAFEI